MEIESYSLRPLIAIPLRAILSYMSSEPIYLHTTSFIFSKPCSRYPGILCLQVSSENNGYRFSVTYHYPKPGNHVLDDCMSNLEGIPFSTIDNDSSAGSCAGAYMSGWWFKDCSLCNPTGIIQPVSETVISSDPTSMTWPVPTNMSARFLRMFLKFKVG